MLAPLLVPALRSRLPANSAGVERRSAALPPLRRSSARSPLGAHRRVAFIARMRRSGGRRVTASSSRPAHFRPNFPMAGVLPEPSPELVEAIAKTTVAFMQHMKSTYVRGVWCGTLSDDDLAKLEIFLNKFGNYASTKSRVSMKISLSTDSLRGD